MEKVKKIINSISWVIVALTGILLIVKWNDIPALVITHIGMGISYGSKNILPMLFCIELVVTFLFTLRYDIPFIREMRKSKVSRKFLDIMAIIIQMVGVVILSLFVLLAVVQWGCKSQLSFTSNLPNSLKLSESIIEGLVGGQLISSILAVSCVTVAFCSNFLMVQDKANGTIRDLRISPVKAATLSLSYYVATLFSTLIICFAATGICLTYVAIVGWYMSLADIFFLFLDILLLVLFGTALSSIINFYN